MFSSGTPSSDSSETKLCRSSRGAQSLALSPAAVDHRAEAAQDVVPVERGPGPGHEDEAVAFGAVLAPALMPQRGERVDASLGHGERAAGFAGLGVPSGTD